MRTTRRRSPGSPRSPRPILARASLLIMVALCGLTGGLIAWPAVRVAYYARMAGDPNDTTRMNALNILSALSLQDSATAAVWLDAILREQTIGTPETRALVDKMAVWTLERSSIVQSVALGRLPAADNTAFLVLAEWLSRAGTWHPPRVDWESLSRRERLRLTSPDPATRLAAVRKLADYGRPAGPFLAEVLPSALGDPDESVRLHAVCAATLCLEEQSLSPLLTACYTDTSEGVRRQAVLFASARGLAIPVRLQNDPAASVREAVAWALGRLPTPDAGPALVRLLEKENDPGVRAMAVWAIGRRSTSEEGARAVLVDAAGAGDSLSLARGLVAAGRCRWAGEVEQMLAGDPVLSGEAELAAAYALGRCSERGGTAAVQNLLETGLDSGNGALVAIACEALAALGDVSALPLMLDLACDATDQPMVQYVAAASALKLNPSAGQQALLHLLDHPSDVICDLAALQLAEADEPPLAALRDLLVLGNERSRASAALALAFAGRADVSIEGRPLSEWLADRTDPESDRHEDRWKPHGYYLCARLALGDRGVREKMDPFIRNASFPRIGLYATLLHAGDPLPLDLLLTRPGRLDVESFLRDARFIEIIRRYDPDAPTFDWFEDEPLRRWQIDRLREYWRVRREWGASAIANRDW